MSDSRLRGSISSSPSFYRSPSMSVGGGGAGGAAAAAAHGSTAAAGHTQAHRPDGSFWTHHEIDYSWRFPYPDHQQKEYFSPHSYIDEDSRRHSSRGGKSLDPPAPPAPEPWRSRERMRTQCVALVACLNIGVDPPDVVKPSPCARVECWVDPESMLPAKALRAIGGRLQLQYERWHEKARYKPLLDPTADELRKALIALRRVANDERLLLHYNGHGVPKPTANGEIWVYNKGSHDGPPTQYIPVSLYDLQTWMGGVAAPSIYVFDASNAGIIVDAFQHFIKQRREKLEAKLKQQASAGAQAKNNAAAAAAAAGGGSAAAGEEPDAPAGVADDSGLAASLHDPCRHILLAACGAHEQLPLNPDLPADLFTACLTTPIKMALRWFVSRSLLNTHANTVGSNAQDAHGAFMSGPASTPAGGLPTGPPSNRHRLYDLIDKLPGIRKPSNRKSPYGELNWIFTAITDSIAWNILPRALFQKLFRQDLLVSSLFRNFLLAQRIMSSYHCNVISVPAIASTVTHPLWACWDLACDIALSQLERFERHGTPFSPSTFFEEQLTSFEIWLEFGSSLKPPPMQLPVVLQVLLSTDHRLRALQLLARFIDKGPWAINLALSVGIFPYVLKLLQSPSKELREVLVFIWCKILALDRAVQADLSKIEYAQYFVQHLLKFEQASAANPYASGSGSGSNTHRAGHSRNSSISPSPYMRPASVTSTPAGSQAYGYASVSGANSAAATPLVHGVAGDSTPQFPRPDRSANPPPLDLPPSNNLDAGAASHSAHLRDHPPQQREHMHMRAQPLHDPAMRLADTRASTNDEEEKSNGQMFHSALPPMHPAPTQQRVPFPLDLSAPSAGVSSSPMHSPTSASSNRPSPMLTGIAFSPISPLLSPVASHRGLGGVPEFAGQNRFEEKQQSSSSGALPDSMSDAHDLTRLAREILATTPLQHLLTVFILTCIAHANPKGQQTLLQSGLSFKDLAAVHLMHSADVRLRKWTCLCIAKLWQGFGHAKSLAAQEQIPEQLCQLLMDPVPEVRAAALYALGSFFGGKTAPHTGTATAGSTISPTHTQRNLQSMRAQQRLDLEIQLGEIMCTMMNDGSPLVRRELQIALAELIYFQQDLFLAIATAHPRNRESIHQQGWHIWRAVLRGCRDCSMQVQEVALAIKNYLKARAILNQSQLGRMIGSQHNPGLHLYNRSSSGGLQHENIEEESGAGSGAGSPSGSRRGSVSREQSPSVRAPSTTQRAGPVGEQSIAHFDHDDSTALHGDDGAPLTAAMLSHDFHDRDAASGGGLPPMSKNNAPPIRHFNRFHQKMGHMRPGPSGPGGVAGGAAGTSSGGSGSSTSSAGGQRRSTDKSSILKSLEGGAPADAKQGDGSQQAAGSTGTLDERAADQMWQIPKSRVFEESYAAFGLPLLTSSSEPATPVPSMTEIRHTKWRHARNQAVLGHAWDLRHTHPSKSSYVEVALLNADWESTGCVAFHPYENMLLATDNKSLIGVWNYSPDEERSKEKLNSFNNDNPLGTKITQLELLNDLHVSLLLTASDDGVVRVWRNIHEEGRQKLVTAWVANPQPEVYYANNNNAAAANTPAATALGAPMHLDHNLITPSQSFQPSEPLSGNAPAARLASRNHSGVGIAGASATPTAGQSMRHSVSTPALVGSVGAAPVGSLMSRSGSFIMSNQGGFMPSPAAFAAQRSPIMGAVQSSPSTGPSSGAMNIPSFSLGNAAAAPIAGSAQQRMSSSQSPPQPQQPASGQVWPVSGSTASRRKQKPPLIVEWQQNKGRLLASGNGLELIRIWNVEQELCVNDIPLLGMESVEMHAPLHATSITSNGADMSWVGCSDGALRCFDLRLSPLQSLVSTARLHRSAVHSVRLQRHGHDGGMLISSSVGGDIALADVRMVDSSVLRYHRSSHKDKTSLLSAFAVHDYSAICASGSHKPFIEIFDHAGTTMDTIRYHVGFLGQRIGPISTLAFHPHKLLLAAGSMDSHISIFAGEKSW